jgi:hypothetical protein
MGAFCLRVKRRSDEEVLHRVKEERNIVHTIKRRKANWIGHILCRKYLLKHVIEGKIQGITGKKTYVATE